MLDLQTRRELGKGVEGARVLNAHPLDPIALSTLPNLPLLSNCLFVNVFASTKRCIAPKFIYFVFLVCLSRRIPLQELDLVANEMWTLQIKKILLTKKKLFSTTILLKRCLNRHCLFLKLARVVFEN